MMNYKKYKNSSGKNYLWIIIKSSKEIDSNGVHLKAIKNSFQIWSSSKKPWTEATQYDRVLLWANLERKRCRAYKNLHGSPATLFLRS